MKIRFPEIVWRTPPSCQGQIVVVSYGDDHNGYFWRRTVNQADQSVQYAVSRSVRMCDCGCFEPWEHDITWIDIDFVDIARMGGTWEFRVELPLLFSLEEQRKYRGAVARVEGLGSHDPIEFICDGGAWNKMDN